MNRLLTPRPATFLLLAVGLLGAACGGSSEAPPQTPLQIVSFTASPERLEAPGEVELAWETRGATAITLSRDGQAVELGGASTSKGSVVVPLEASAAFELIALGRGADLVTAQLEVVVMEPPPAPAIGSFSGPEVVGLDEGGVARALLSWTGVVNASELYLEADGLEQIDLEADDMPDGSIEVELSEDTALTLVAGGEGGEISADVEIRVVPLPTIEDLRADRLKVGAGEDVVIAWTTTDATNVELRLDGVLIETPAPLPTTGSTPVTILLGGELELRASNEVGAEARRSIAIAVGSPEVHDLRISEGLLWLGDSITIEWETLGGAALEVLASGIEEPICAEDDPARIAQSSCEWEPPSSGEWTLSLEVENASGVAGDRRELAVRAGPELRLFTVSPQTLVLGEEVAIAWAAISDPAGNAPSLTLADGRGNTQALGSVEGSFALTPDQAGAWSFTLRAETEHERSIAAEASVEIEVLPAPVVGLTATPENFDDSVDEHVTLAWTSADVDALVLYQLTDGDPIELLVIPAAERAAGSLQITPTVEATYRLVGKGALGRTAQADASVTVAPTEVLSFTADPLAITLGQSVLLEWSTRMADEVSLDIADRRYLVEETTEPFLDVEAMGAAHLPLTADCGAIDTAGCALVSFPTDFSFRFGDTDYASLRVYGNGVISFDAPTNAPFSGGNVRFPSADSAWAHLAPFWSELAWNAPDAQRPVGDVHVLRIDDGALDALVIQWKDVKFSLQDWRDASLNFEVILHADGAFEYRYGEMFPGSAPPSSANGEEATIGFQLPDRSESDVRAFEGQVRPIGSIAHRTFTYRPAPALEKNGSLRWYPYTNQETITATLQVRRGESVHSKPITLQVSRRPELALVPRSIEATPAGAEFQVGWTTTAATAVELVDEGDRVRCQAASPLEVANGFCMLEEQAQANYTYRLRATGANGFVAERTIGVPVYEEPFGIASFQADRDVVLSGESVTLSWDADRAASVSLLANGVELLPDGAPTGPGSLTVDALTRKTTFTLRVENTIGMVAEQSLEVELRLISIDVATSAPTARPGQPFTITVDSTALDGGANPTIFGNLPLIEVTDPASRYSDISGRTDVQVLNVSPTATSSINDLDFPAGFTFPYFGESHSAIRVFLDGYATFTTGAANQGANQVFPVTSANAALKAAHLAPFWDDLHPRNVAKMYAALIDPDTYVIQWSHLSTNAGTSNALPLDLNFQLVLRRSGAFEFRYGAMQPHVTPPTSGSLCRPTTDCAAEVGGSSATIGYQKIDASTGWNLQYGTGTVTSEPYPGGLTNRTFRYEPFTGSRTFSYRPFRSETFEFCGFAGVELVCREVDVPADYGIDSFSTSASSIAPGQSAALRWKSHGAAKLTIYANGAELYSTTDFATIDVGTLPVTPQGHTTYTLEIEAGANLVTASTRIEVERLQLTATATPSTYPGQPITLSWTLSSADPLAQPIVLRPLEEATSLPFAAYDLSTDTDATELVPANNAGKNTLVNFGAGFSFDYFGTAYTSMIVSSEGYINFDTSVTTVYPNNQRLPSSNPVHLAPFWDNLHTRASGRVWAKQFDPDTFVVQWSRTSVDTGSNNNPYNLNFMVVLRRGGDFEFRYGDMQQPANPSSLCKPESCRDEANGSSATIGYQTVGGQAAALLHYGGAGSEVGRLPMAGGLSNRTFRYVRGVGNGSVQLTPGESTVYRICAIDPANGDTFCAEPVAVEASWGIDSFDPTPAAPAAGESIALRWKVHGLDELIVTANGADIASYAGIANVPASGEATHQPTADTTYELIGRSMGRELREVRVVPLRTLDLQIQGPPPGRHLPGSQVELSWTATPRGSGDLFVASPMGEVQGSPFLDVSGLTGAVELPMNSYNGMGEIELPDGFGFPFPYFGTTHTRATIYVGGYLSFDPPFGASYTQNGWLPAPGNDTTRRIHLAPFWDGLLYEGPAKVWLYKPDADSFIVQWSHFDRSTNWTNADDRYDLNFQIVLFRDGSFEYRYGAMNAPISPPTYESDRCMPSSCVREANGAGATIGYQTVDAAFGNTLHFGGMELQNIPNRVAWDEGTVSGLQEVQGGLSNRSFRYSPAKTGTAKITVGRSREHTICAVGGAFSECRTVALDAVADPGELMITEVMIRPTGGLARQWFEVRNLSHRTIDLEGFQLRTSTAAHTIGRSLPVTPGSFLLFAASANAAAAPADYVYGAELALGAVADRLELVAGSASIASMHWGVDWSIPVSRSLGLDPRFQRLGIETLDDAGMWCGGTETGTPGEQGAGCSNDFYNVDPTSQRPFIEIAAIGSRVYDLEKTGTLAPLSLQGLSFPFFGESFDRIWIGSMGWISFSESTPGTPGLTPPIPPRAAGHALAGPLIAPFWANLSCERQLFDCRILQWRGAVEGEEVQIIQWQDFQLRSSIQNAPAWVHTGSISFQVQLWASGDIVVAFDVVQPSAPVRSADWSYYFGTTAWVGIEARDRTNFLSAHFQELLELQGRSFHFQPK